MADYYRQLLSTETAYLKNQIAKFTIILDRLTGDTVDSDGRVDSAPASAEVVESVIGQIRLAIGQSNLFINERFKQFSGLIEDCEQRKGEKEIKVEDLAGFWDMIYYQVEDLKGKYATLEAAERNNWASMETAVSQNGTSSSSVEIKPAGKANKRAANKTSPTGSTTNGSAAVAPVKKPAGRSNFREFLKNKRKEMPVVNGGAKDAEPVVEILNGSSTTTNGALTNGTSHHLNGFKKTTNGVVAKSTPTKETGIATVVATNGHHDTMLEIQKLKNLTETLSLLQTPLLDERDEMNKEN